MWLCKSNISKRSWKTDVETNNFAVYTSFERHLKCDATWEVVTEEKKESCKINTNWHHKMLDPLTVIVSLFHYIIIFKQTKSGFTWKSTSAPPNNWFRGRGREWFLISFNKTKTKISHSLIIPLWFYLRWHCHSQSVQHSTWSKQAVFCFSKVVLWNLCLIFSLMFDSIYTVIRTACYT